MVQEILEYVKFTSDIKNHIDQSPYKTSFFYEALKMNKQTFYRKMRDSTFTPDEVLQIARILNPEENHKLELKAALNRSEQDYKKGRIKSHEEVIKNLREKYLG